MKPTDKLIAFMTELKAIGASIRNKTGKTEEVGFYQLRAEIDGIQVGGGGETFPQKIYETDFVMDESVTENGTICTISTGLSNRMVTDDNELVMCVIACEPTVTPTGHWVKKMVQFISPNQLTIEARTFGFYVQCTENNGTELRKSFNSAVGAYISSVTEDLSSVTISARFNACTPAVGNYHLELYKLGVVV